MKMQTQFILASLAIALVSAGSAVAGGPQLQVLDNHHGASIYLARPAEMQPTIAFGGHAKGETRNDATATRTLPSSNGPRRSLRVVATPHGTVSYFAPAP